MSQVAVIVGSGGQDGQLLYSELRRRGYVVITIRRGDLELEDPVAVRHFLRDTTPGEVYFLAAHHHSSQQNPNDEKGESFRRSVAVHFDAAVNFVDAIATVTPATRMFYASSSLIYKPRAPSEFLSEAVTPQPEGDYAITKMAGMLACHHYRRSRGVFVSVGILFNHESRLRGEHFLSRKIIQTAVRIKRGESLRLELGDFEAQVDWGYAPDYVSAMHCIMQLDEPGDFVIATGELHSVRDFAAYAFGCLGLDYGSHVIVNPAVLTRLNSARRGDARKLRAMCGWTPTRSFKVMVEELVQEELASASTQEFLASLTQS